jgi:hypothetical protein
MSVRGTTHARIHRKVVIREGEDTGGKITCAWSDCDKDGYLLHHIAVNVARPGFPCQLERYVFCSERHKQYFIHSYRTPAGHGRLPAGFRGTIL